MASIRMHTNFILSPIITVPTAFFLLLYSSWKEERVGSTRPPRQRPGYSVAASCPDVSYQIVCNFKNTHQWYTTWPEALDGRRSERTMPSKQNAVRRLFSRQHSTTLGSNYSLTRYSRYRKIARPPHVTSYSNPSPKGVMCPDCDALVPSTK